MSGEGVALIVQAAILVGAVTTLCGALGWLLGPRIGKAVETACAKALGQVIQEHDDRLERLEEWRAASQSPTNLVELAALFDLVNRHTPHPDPEPGMPDQPRRRKGHPHD